MYCWRRYSSVQPVNSEISLNYSKMNTLHWLSLIVVCVLSNEVLASKYQRVVNAVADRQLRYAKSSRVLISNDFENGIMTPWYNESPGKSSWEQI